MIYKTPFTVLISLLIFSFLGCGNLKMQRNETEYKEIGGLSAPISNFGVCYEDGMIKRLWNKTEGADSYRYWKNRKPFFAGDGKISIFLRNSPFTELQDW